MKLFFIPYAGGSASSYSILKKHISPDIDVILVELSGRGKRINEPFYSDIYEAVEDVIKVIEKESGNDSYSIFGHSMGGLIIYELLKKIEKTGMAYPKHIFISSRRAPHLKSLYGKRYCELPEKEFIFELSKLGEMNKEFSKAPELFKIFLPIIRSDYKLVEDYIFKEPIKKLKCNATLLYAIDDDEASKEEVLQWTKYIDKEVDCFEFKGGHFYIFGNVEKVNNIINNTLYQYID